MYASENDRAEIIKMLLVQEGIRFDGNDIILFLPNFISFILYFTIIFGIYSNNLEHFLCMQSTKVNLKL